MSDTILNLKKIIVTLNKKCVENRDYVIDIQYLTKVSTPLTFLHIFLYIFPWDNTEEMTL